MKELNRRNIVTGSLIAVGAYAAASVSGVFDQANAGTTRKFPVTKTPEQWKAQLGPARYNILRQAGTERPYSSPLNEEKRKGIFACAGCNNQLYSSSTKFDSGTGWPSFWQPIAANRIVTSTDYKLGFPRTEVLCARCGGHQGHVFDDGPKPTGKRHCINGLALNFIRA